MGSSCPNLLKTVLVRHVQLIALSVQVAYLYLVPMYPLATRTTLAAVGRPAPLFLPAASFPFLPAACFSFLPAAVILSPAASPPSAASSGFTWVPLTTITASATARPPPTEPGETSTA